MKRKEFLSLSISAASMAMLGIPGCMLADNIVFLHLRDQLNNGRWPEALGEGDVDFAAIGNIIREINFNGDIIIELAFESGVNGTRPIRESLKISREYLQEVAGL